MSNDNKTPVVETTIEALEQEIPVVPVAKTKKELKKERKAIKKHKKQVMKEAKLHSAKSTKAFKTIVTVVSLIVIASMIFCSFTAVKITQNVLNSAEGTAQEQTTVETQTQAAGDSAQSTPSTTPSTPAESTTSAPSSDEATTSAPAADEATTSAPAADEATTSAPAADEATTSAPSSSDSAQSTPSTTPSAPAENATQGSANAASDINTKEGAVEYFKKAHAKVFAEAKSVTRTYDNPTNYNNVVDVGGNSTISGIASTLMNTFMKPNEEAVVFTGSDEIKAHFPPANANGTTGLTADMIGNYSVKEEGGNYIITLSLNSTEENPDDGTMAQHMVEVVGIDVINESAGGMVTIDGFKNLYIGSTVVATIEKDTGKKIALDVDNPSYMCFGKAKALFITVENCKLGLHYEQKWTVQW